MTVLSKSKIDRFQFSLETMGDWLHCNTCYKQPGDGRGYFLTNCGHLYCEGCQSKGWLENCLLCGTNKPSALKLTSKLTPPVDSYFAEPIKMLKQVLATMEFQHHQRKRYVSQLQKIVSNQREIVDKHERELKSRIREKFDIMDRENTKLKEENSYLKRLINNDKSYGSSMRSPSAYDKYRYNNSPGQKGYGSPSGLHQISRTSSTSSIHRKISPGSGLTMVTSGRVSVRTPPSGGRMGVIPQSTPSPLTYTSKCTPKSVPHPIGFDVNMETPPR